MVLIDTSCWIDFLRRADTRARIEVRRMITEQEASLVMCEPIAMELLAGAASGLALKQIEHLVNGLPSLDFDPISDFRAAAEIQRSARAQGRTVRSIIDCLIAVLALRQDVELVHKDADFELIASVTGLRTRSLL